MTTCGICTQVNTIGNQDFAAVSFHDSGRCASSSWHSSSSHIRTKGEIAGSELVRRFIALSHAAFSGSLHVQPSGLKVTIEPSLCRQVKRKFTKSAYAPIVPSSSKEGWLRRSSPRTNRPENTYRGALDAVPKRSLGKNSVPFLGPFRIKNGTGRDHRGLLNTICKAKKFSVSLLRLQAR
jgi:hypothetical protein